MTESEWDACSNPQKMLESLANISGRKLHLLCSAACRQLWHLLESSRLREAVGALERYADAEIDEASFRGFASETHPIRIYRDELLSNSVREDRWLMAYGINSGMFGLRKEVDCFHFFTLAADYGRRDAQQAFGMPVKPCDIDCVTQADLIRDLIVNPISPLTLSPSWLTWNDAVVIRLAQTAYDNRILPAGTLDNTCLAILADALEEAGCINQRILGHLRGGSEHYRGCFVVDALLGKS